MRRINAGQVQARGVSELDLWKEYRQDRELGAGVIRDQGITRWHSAPHAFS